MTEFYNVMSKETEEQFMARTVPMKDVLKLVRKMIFAANNFPNHPTIQKHPDGSITTGMWKDDFASTIKEVTGLDLEFVEAPKKKGKR